MNTTHEKHPWYGFTEDQVFGEVMSDPEICKYILQIIVPEAKIKQIYLPLKQKEVKDPQHREQKDIRLDILAEDYDHNLYDLEVQTSDKGDLGWRMRYYASKIDQRYTLETGKTYRDLKNVKIIFLCTFDPESKGKVKYTYEEYEKEDKSDQLNDGLEKIIINSKGNSDHETPELQALVDLMNGKPVHLNKYFKRIQKKIAEINNDPIWRDKIMDYETKLKEREQEGKEEGLKEGVKKGVKEGTILGIKKLVNILRNMGNSNDEIMQQLESNYSDSFSKKELETFMKQA